MLKIAQTVLLSLFLSAVAFADTLTIRDDAPSQYVVKKGDTLWDISAMYLNSPWMWPELWGKNPQIDNPHLIYPGDVLRLVYGADGQPRLVVASSQNVVKVSPTKRTTIKRYQPVETLPLSEITPYLRYERILMGDEFNNAPMLLGGTSHTKRKIAGNMVYAKGRLNIDEMYGVYKKSREIIDTEGDVYYELSLAGTARLIDYGGEGGTHKVRLLTNLMEMNQGDRLIPLLSDQSLPASYTLTIPEDNISTTILATSSKSSEFGKLEVVIINNGSNDGLRTGNVLGIYSASPNIMMEKGLPVYEEDASQFTRLMNKWQDKKSHVMPVEVIGQMVVFKVYEEVSYALITKNNQVVRLQDTVGMPKSM
ncbi:LysM peptidoglycan-binding domain-containing protein [Algibacillus agarilyticus]|uniref:LysM peptidoglycan-binding domain-containing protein n=1 Tax=Algibacillus agarilyticus TaxID=2234133 RepID=UPI000DCF90E3|nr:LysM domain-containing protein [Algibacillus agarilyticus]